MSGVPSHLPLRSSSFLPFSISPSSNNRKLNELNIRYRITGDPTWQEKGWKMFEAIQRYTRTELGFSAIADVTSTAPFLRDEQESFWTAETLKYFFLLFSEPDVVSLDDWVL